MSIVCNSMVNLRNQKPGTFTNTMVLTRSQWLSLTPRLSSHLNLATWVWFFVFLIYFDLVLRGKNHLACISFLYLNQAEGLVECCY